MVFFPVLVLCCSKCIHCVFLPGKAFCRMTVVATARLTARAESCPAKAVPCTGQCFSVALLIWSAPLSAVKAHPYSTCTTMTVWFLLFFMAKYVLPFKAPETTFEGTLSWIIATKLTEQCSLQAAIPLAKSPVCCLRGKSVISGSRNRRLASEVLVSYKPKDRL